MKSNRDPFPIIWSISPFKIPKYLVDEPKDRSINIIPLDSVFDESFQTIKGIEYDINRVSSRNARKSELGPYKNSFLREIISSYSMGKTSGTKSDLVSTILSYHSDKK